MLRSVSVTFIFLASAAPALGQRGGENAVASAQDAFGTSVGNERVGLYFPQSGPSSPSSWMPASPMR